MSTILYDPGLNLTADILGMSSSLGGETSDTLTSSWTALGKVKSFAVLALVTNVVETQIVTLVIRTASDSSGTGSAVLTPKTESDVLTVTGTATATLKTLLVGECNAIPAGATHVQAELETDDTDGTEVVSMALLRKLSD